MNAATASDQLLFLNFSNINGVNSRKMEFEMLPDEFVSDTIRDMVRVHLSLGGIPNLPSNIDRDRLVARNQELQLNWLRETSTPTFAVATPDGKEILSRFVGYSPSVEEFRQFLTQGINKWAERKLTATNPDTSAAK